MTIAPAALRKRKRQRPAEDKHEHDHLAPGPAYVAPSGLANPFVHPSRRALVPQAHVLPDGRDPQSRSPAPTSPPEPNLVLQAPRQPVEHPSFVTKEETPPSDSPDSPAKARKLEPFRDPSFPHLPLERRRDGSVAAETLRTLTTAAAVQMRCPKSGCDCYKYSEALVAVRRRVFQLRLTAQIGYDGPRFFESTSPFGLRTRPKRDFR